MLQATNGVSSRVIITSTILIGLLGGAARVLSAPPTLFPRDGAGHVIFQEVVTADGTSANELRRRAEAWIAATYQSAKDFRQSADKDGRRLLLSALVIERPRPAFLTSQPDWIRQTVVLDFDEGRYRYSVTNLSRVVVEYPPSRGIRSELEIRIVKDQRIEDLLDRDGKPKLLAKSLCQYVYEDISDLIVSLKTAMAAGDATPGR